MRKPLDLGPVRRVLCWQAGLTAAAMAIGGFFAGGHGVASAALGGGINVVANAGYALGMRLGARPLTAGATLITLFRAEAIKLAVVLGLLCLVLTVYKDIQIVVFFVTFFITVLAFGTAFLQR